MERVVGDPVGVQVGPDVPLGPVGQRVELPEPEPGIPGELRCPGPGLGVLPADPRNPALDLREGPLHRLDLADRAAGVGIALPELVAVEPRLFVERDRVVALELDPEPLGQSVAGRVRLGKEDVGVEVEEACVRVYLGGQVEDDRARLLERASEVEVLAELLEPPGDNPRGIHRLELGRDLLGVEALG